MINKLVLGLFMLLIGANVAVADDSDHEIDLRLFGEADVAPYDGCRLAYWQRDRDPLSDKFAYVFFAPFNDGEMLPAWIKVNDAFIEVEKKHIGADGGRLDRFQVYQDEVGDYRVLVDVLEQSETASGLGIQKARMTILSKEKFPFNMTVTGHLHCPGLAPAQSAADSAGPVQSGRLYGDQISLSSANEFQGYDQVPPPLRQFIAANLSNCDPESTAGYGASYAISDALTLWEVPCALYPTHGSSVYAVAEATKADYFIFLTFPTPDGPSSEYELQQAEVLPATAEIRAVSTNNDGSCGRYERFQLRAVEGESLEPVLLELRRRDACDGAAIRPEEFPLLYLAQ